MDIGKLYETLTGEPCPHAPRAFVEAAWGLSKDGLHRAGVPSGDDRGLRRQRDAKPEVRPEA